MTIAVVMLANRFNQEIIHRFEAISCPSGYSKFLVLDQTADRASGIEYLRRVSFSDVIAAGYQPIENSLLPGSNHFSIVDFAASGQYDYVWKIEYDVLFTGQWRDFFQAHAGAADLLTALVETWESNPKWWWWKTLHGPETIPSLRRLRAFNPIYRFSTGAARYVQQQFALGWRGHHEVSMPTLLSRGGFIVVYLGANGPFVRDVNCNRRDTPATYSHRPLQLNRRKLIKDILMHPVKALPVG